MIADRKRTAVLVRKNTADGQPDSGMFRFLTVGDKPAAFRPQDPFGKAGTVIGYTIPSGWHFHRQRKAGSRFLHTGALADQIFQNAVEHLRIKVQCFWHDRVFRTQPESMLFCNMEKVLLYVLRKFREAYGLSLDFQLLQTMYFSDRLRVAFQPLCGFFNIFGNGDCLFLRQTALLQIQL